MDKRQFIKTALLGTGCLLGSWQPPRATANGLGPGSKKWTKKAIYFTDTAKGVQCQLCPNECTLKPGEKGDCRNRANIDGVLYSLAYGNPCSVHVDPVEKKPLYHFLPGSNCYSVATAGCNFACLNCQNWTISQKSPDETQNIDLMPDKLVAACIEGNCRSIAYTYSEPITFYEYMYDTSVLSHQQNIKNLMITAGYIHPKPLTDLCKVIDAANVDLKSFSNDIYLKLNGGKLQPVLDTLTLMKKEGVWLEITNLVVPSWTDDLEMIKRMCGWLTQHGFDDTPLHFSRFHPMYKLTQLPPTPVEILKSARAIALQEGLQHVYIGNVPGAGAENTSCPHCHQTVVERKGFAIVQNHLTKGKCHFCQQSVAGVWE